MRYGSQIINFYRIPSTSTRGQDDIHIVTRDLRCKEQDRLITSVRRAQDFLDYARGATPGIAWKYHVLAPPFNSSIRLTHSELLYLIEELEGVLFVPPRPVEKVVTAEQLVAERMSQPRSSLGILLSLPFVRPSSSRRGRSSGSRVVTSSFATSGAKVKSSLRTRSG